MRGSDGELVGLEGCSRWMIKRTVRVKVRAKVRVRVRVRDEDDNRDR